MTENYTHICITYLSLYTSIILLHSANMLSKARLNKRYFIFIAHL